jgi:hypothetical protein
MEKSQMVKHIKLRNDLITPKDKRKKPYHGETYIVIDGHKYRYVGVYASAQGAFDAWKAEHFNQEYVIIPYGGYGNPALPGLFVSVD